MAGHVNGKETNTVNLVAYNAYLKLNKEFLEFLNEKRTKAKDEDAFNKMCVVVFTNLASVLAVDTGMERERFLAISSLNFDNAYEQAPKWG